MGDSKKQKTNIRDDNLSENYILSIPREMLITIINYLCKKDKATSRIVCKTWNNIITNYDLFWKDMWVERIVVKKRKIWYHRRDLPKDFCKCDQNKIFDDGKGPHPVRRSHYYYEFSCTYDEFLLKKVQRNYFRACLLHFTYKRDKKTKFRYNIPFLLN